MLRQLSVSWRSFSGGMSRSSPPELARRRHLGRDRHAGDPVGPERAQPVPEPAPGHQVPVGGGRANVAERLDLSLGDRPGAVGVADPQHPPRLQRVRDQSRHRGGRRRAAGLAEQVNTLGQLLGGGRVARLHRRHQLAQRRPGVRPERRAVQLPQRHRQRHRLARGQVHRRQRPRLVQAVAAGAAGLGPDRHPRLLQRADIPLDRPHADLEPPRQPARAPRPRRDRPQLLDDGVQPIRPVHAANLTTPSDIPPPPPPPRVLRRPRRPRPA